MTNWILIADAAGAVIYEPELEHERLRAVRNFDHPSGRAHVQELVSARVGHARQPGPRGLAPAMAAPTDPHTLEAERFAGELAVELAAAYHRRDFHQLALIAPPRFLGLLRAALDAHVASAVVASAANDLTPIPPHDLWPHVREIVRRLSEPNDTRNG